jgi:hypothetical protein
MDRTPGRFTANSGLNKQSGNIPTGFSPRTCSILEHLPLHRKKSIVITTLFQKTQTQPLFHVALNSGHVLYYKSPTEADSMEG